MEEDHHQELRFVCKLCNNKYPCGKSLAGHMRSHGVANSAESKPSHNHNHKTDHLPHNHLPSLSPDPFGINGQFNSSYGLRENPRKTWRAVDSTAPFPFPQDRICKQCGKGFHSLKALCGHMASHSDRDHKPFKDIDHSWTVTTSDNHKQRQQQQQQQLVSDSHSDTEEEPMVHTRSLSKPGKRYKKILVKSSSMTLPHPPSTTNGSSSVSEIDGEEQEEVAMCLMLLSRDSRSKGGINYAVESSDNNSVILETKSSSIDKNIVHDQGKFGDGILKSSAADVAPPTEVEEENSDSGYFLDEHYSGKFRNMSRSFRAVPKRELTKESEYYDGYIRISRIVRKDDSPNAEASSASPPKRSKYECFNCKKTFKSYQALGGHRPCHKKTNAYYESRCNSDENSLDDSTEFVASRKHAESARNQKSSGKKNKVVKKNKGHVCPFCDRVFKNGQALGGHKRSHFIGSHEIRNKPIPAKPDLLDLNLPAPEEDDNKFPRW